MLGEEWHPIKVDRVLKSSICPSAMNEITESTKRRIAQENGVLTSTPDYRIPLPLPCGARFRSGLLPQARTTVYTRCPS